MRLAKTRSQASDACKGGHVRVNGEKVKPAQSLKVGDQVRVRRSDGWERIVTVTRLIAKRVGPPVAAACYLDQSPPPPAREFAGPVAVRDRGAGRPTKRDRREVDRLRGAAERCSHRVAVTCAGRRGAPLGCGRARRTAPPPCRSPPNRGSLPTMTARPLLNRSLAEFGTTIFAEMSQLALDTGSINLGQGFPDTDGPAAVLEAARRAIAQGRGNQYPPGPGIPELRRAVAEHRRADYGLDYDPDGEVLVTAGATEAIAAALLALLEPGDEVVALEPYYDSYAACIAMAGARRVPVTLRPDGDRFVLDLDELRAAVTGRTRLLLLNTPHNPTGAVLPREQLAAIAELCVERDLIAVTDEVYEHLVFDGAQHVPLATLPGMRERTVSISSAGKTFSVTGWKVGWVCASRELTAAVRTAKQFLTYVSSGPVPVRRGRGAGAAARRTSPRSPRTCRPSGTCWARRWPTPGSR